MEYTPHGPVPVFDSTMALPELAWEACPGKGVGYADLYRQHYGKLPENWLLGPVVKARVAYAADPEIRRGSSSGGVITRVLVHLLASGKVDAAIVVRQGLPSPEQARVVLAGTVDALRACSQSVYIPVSVLDILPLLEDGKRYAITCLPDQAAALRRLQLAGHPKAKLIQFVLGPYTGTALYPAAIHSFLRSWGVPANDPVVSLQWRAGEWPGYLEIRTQSGRVIRSLKFYYNYLIPFFITQNSLQGMDFANEFCDLSAGDAWSPQYEQQGGGYSVVLTRTPAMEAIVAEMIQHGELVAEEVEPLKAAEMHGHMIDFKKRGSYVRNRIRQRLGLKAPDHGLRPVPLPVSRVLVELVIFTIFLVCRSRWLHWLVERLPEKVIGPCFNRFRLAWKGFSKPAKRKGLKQLTMLETEPQKPSL